MYSVPTLETRARTSARYIVRRPDRDGAEPYPSVGRVRGPPQDLLGEQHTVGAREHLLELTSRSACARVRPRRHATADSGGRVAAAQHQQSRVCQGPGAPQERVQFGGAAAQ